MTVIIKNKQGWQSLTVQVTDIMFLPRGGFREGGGSGRFFSNPPSGIRPFVDPMGPPFVLYKNKFGSSSAIIQQYIKKLAIERAPT